MNQQSVISADETLDSPARLLDEERELWFAGFGKDDAWTLGCRMRQAASDRRLPVAIAIRVNGQLLFHTALDGSSADNDAWLRRKAAVAERYAHSSLYVGADFRSHGRDFDTDARLPADEYAAKGGAFPILVRGVGAIGSVTVSGLPDREDHAFVVEQLRAFRSPPPPRSPAPYTP